MPRPMRRRLSSIPKRELVSTKDKLISPNGEFDEAEKLAREAPAIFKKGVEVRDRADALVDLAQGLDPALPRLDHLSGFTAETA